VYLLYPSMVNYSTIGQLLYLREKLVLVHIK